MIQLAPLRVGVRRAFQSLACLLAACLPAAAQFQAAELIPSVNASGNEFGKALAIDGDTAVVGAVNMPHTGSVCRGAAFIFRRVGGAWIQETMIPADATNGQYFGKSVAVSGSRVFISSDGVNGAGNVSVYRRLGSFPFSTWDLIATLEASDPTANQYFGTSIAASGNTLLVGSERPGALGTAVYFFQPTGGSWQLAQRVPVDGDYGRTVCIDGPRAAVARIAGGYNQNVVLLGLAQSGWQIDAAIDVYVGPTLGQVTATPPISLRGDMLICGQPSAARVTIARAFGSSWTIPVQLDWPSKFSPQSLLGSAVATDGTRFVATVPSNFTGGAYDPFVAVGEWPVGASAPVWLGAFRPDDDLTYLRGVAMSGDLVICRDEHDEDVKVLTLVPPAPVTYCTGKLNSAGCVAIVSSVGSASATSNVPFEVNATSVVSGKYGLLFFGINGRTAFPFQGGYLCALPPTRRTPAQSSGGSAGANDCTGGYSFDFNALIRSGAHPDLDPGVLVNAQYWYRDPASQSTTGLTNAIEFGVGF
jgi:hypothetical protein